MNSSPPLSSQTLREIYVNVLASFPSLSLSLLDIHYNIKKEGEKRGGKKSGGKKRRKKERHTREPKRERNLKKLENRRTRGKPEATVIPMDWTRREKSSYRSSRDRRIFHPKIRSLSLVKCNFFQRERERTWRNGARPINPATPNVNWMTADPSPEHPGQPRLEGEGEEESWRGEERKKARLNGEERKEKRNGGGGGAIAGRSDKAAVSNLVAPLYIQLGKAQTGMERGWGEEASGKRSSKGMGRGWKKSGEQT